VGARRDSHTSREGIISNSEGAILHMMIDGTTTVRSLVTAHPESFDVLMRHGMCADCRADPPEVPLSHFAAKHCNDDLTALLEELRRTLDAETRFDQ